MKTCSKCNQSKPINDFRLNKGSKDGHRPECKECEKQYYQTHKERFLINGKKYRDKNKEYVKEYFKQAYLKTKKEERWRLHLAKAKERCNNPNNDSYSRYGGRGIKCLLSLEEIKYLWFRDKAYDLEHPSIDRLDNDGHYTLENCQFIELLDNSIKGDGTNNKPILQLDLQGNLIKEWSNLREASLIDNLTPSEIIKVCKGDKKEAYGFIWQYK